MLTELESYIERLDIRASWSTVRYAETRITEVRTEIGLMLYLDTQTSA